MEGKTSQIELGKEKNARFHLSHDMNSMEIIFTKLRGLIDVLDFKYQIIRKKLDIGFGSRLEGNKNQFIVMQQGWKQFPLFPES